VHSYTFVRHRASVAKSHLMRYLKILFFICAPCLVLASAYAFAGLRTAATKTAMPINASRQERLSSQLVATPAQTDYVRPAQLWPELRAALVAAGDRTANPGKERLTVTGTLQHANDVAMPLTMIGEYPGHLRLAWQDGTRSHVIVFDEHTADTAAIARLDQFERALVETLSYDTTEHFFAGQMRGVAIRSLGSRFRLDDGTADSYADSVYDVYQITEEVKLRGEVGQQAKLYYFNSDTLLLERVRYETERAGAPVRVEVLMSNWQMVQGQQVPMRIVRTENGQPVLTFTVTAATISPGVADGSFGPA
jgi:hypothetical protein